MTLIERLRAEGEDAMRKHLSLGMWKLCAEAANEIERLTNVLVEIAGDPTGVSSFQSALAKQALGLPCFLDGATE